MLEITTTLREWAKDSDLLVLDLENAFGSATFEAISYGM